MASPVSLPREILKWIQSLDLAYSVKSVKRDFSNGFLVAEIFSRYYEKDIQMHSFDNGTSFAAKQDNWQQLQKFFKKRNICPGGEPITKDEINGVIHSKHSTVIDFLIRIYTFLTGKAVRMKEATSPSDDAPAFARPTAAQVLREHAREPEVRSIADHSVHEMKMRETLESHEQNLQQHKLSDPKRYVPNRAGRVFRGTSRTVGKDEGVAGVKVDKIDVRSISDGVGSIRANREQSPSRVESVGNGTSSRGPGGATSQMGGPPSYRPSLDILSVCVRDQMQHLEIFKTFNSSKSLFVSFVEAVQSMPDFPDAVASAVLNQAAKASSVLADACIASPREFYQVISNIVPILRSTAENSATFAAASSVLVAVGKEAVRREPMMAQSLLRDFALPSLLPLLKHYPPKRHAVLQAVYAYTPGTVTAHFQSIRLLQEQLNDMQAFLHCLTILVFLEPDFNEDLLDLYLYYCLIGMGMTAPPLRAACIAMLSVPAVHAPKAVIGLLDRLEELKDDTWWEVRAQLIVVCSALLQRITEDEEPEAVPRARALIIELLNPKGNPSVLRVGVSYLSKALDNHPQLGPAYVKAILALPAAARAKLLTRNGEPDELPVVGASGGRYRLPVLPNDWAPLIVAKELAKAVAGQKLRHMEVAHFELLAATLPPEGVRLTEGTEGAAVFNEVFTTLQNYLFVGLCDSETCELALTSLRRFMYDMPIGVAVLRAPSLLGTLYLMHEPPEGKPDVLCQKHVADFAAEAVGMGEPYVSAIRQVLQAFNDSHPQLLASSPLGLVASDIEIGLRRK